MARRVGASGDKRAVRVRGNGCVVVCGVVELEVPHFVMLLLTFVALPWAVCVRIAARCCCCCYVNFASRWSLCAPWWGFAVPGFLPFNCDREAGHTTVRCAAMGLLPAMSPLTLRATASWTVTNASFNVATLQNDDGFTGMQVRLPAHAPACTVCL